MPSAHATAGSKRTARHAAELATLAPAVIALRLPLLWAEMMTGRGDGVESTRAVAEKTSA